MTLIDGVRFLYLKGKRKAENDIDKVMCINKYKREDNAKDVVKKEETYASSLSSFDGDDDDVFKFPLLVLNFSQFFVSSFLHIDILLLLFPFPVIVAYIMVQPQIPSNVGEPSGKAAQKVREYLTFGT